MISLSLLSIRVYLMLRREIRYYPLTLSMAGQQTPTPLRMLNSLPARLAALTAVVATFIWAFWINRGTIGYIAETKDGVTTVSAGTSPAAIILRLSSVVLYLLLVNHKVELQNVRIAPMWCRAAAFAVDFWFALFTLSTLFGFVPVLLEALRTGVFRWHFQRDYAAFSNRFDIVLVLLFICAFSAYFVLPLMRGASLLVVGSCVLPQSTQMRMWSVFRFQAPCADF
jgi:hypothetical protein